MNSNMSIYLSMEQAPLSWGENALMSFSDKGITLHLLPDSLERVQQGARAIVQQGIKSVSLQGEGWTLNRCWSFWLGFRSPKFQAEIQWPTCLDKEQETQLFKLIKIVNWVRDTINLPAQDLSPHALAARSIDLLVEFAAEQIQYQLIKGEALKEKGYSGLYNVGKGSSRESVLLTLDFNPTKNPDAPVFACLVGKGITFDSGGYSIKESSYMTAMKSDMGGAALCVGSLGLAILNGLNKRVKLVLCCAENMINGRALKLGDIIHYRNGKTVEVMNTDAEGRLVLADGLIDAAAESPQIIIDCATLTGAAKVAVGGDYHSVFSFNNELVEQLLTAAEQMNEGFWRLPLAERHRTQLPSNFADLSNIAAPNYTAGASTAAGFLSHFVDSYQSNWIHIDCSATYQKSANSLWSAGATGVGVKTLSHFLLQLAQ